MLKRIDSASQVRPGIKGVYILNLHTDIFRSFDFDDGDNMTAINVFLRGWVNNATGIRVGDTALKGLQGTADHWRRRRRISLVDWDLLSRSRPFAPPMMDDIHPACELNYNGDTPCIRTNRHVSLNSFGVLPWKGDGSSVPDGSAHGTHNIYLTSHVY